MIPFPRLIDADGKEVRRIHPVKLSVTENIVPLSTAQMTLLPGDSIPYRSFVEVFTANGSAGYFRAKTPSVGYGNITNTIELEHAICEVGDYIVKGEIEQTSMSLEDAMLEVFSHYDGELWQIGDVDVDAEVVISANYSNVLQTLNSLIALVPSAMMTFDFSTTPWTFNVVARETEVSAEGRLARNIANCTIQRNDNDLCTRVWVKGLSEDPAESYMDGETISTFGVIEKALDGTDYTQEQAELMAASFLEKYQYPSYSVTLNAVDLSSITGETLDRFKIGKLFRLILPDEPNPVEGTIIGITWSDVYGSSMAVSVTLSEEEDQSTYTMLQSQSTDIYGNNGIKEKVEKNYSDVEVAISKRYIIRSGIDINPAGIDVHGSGKYLKARNGALYYGGIARVETEETDLDDLTDPGFYYTSSVEDMSHKPSGVTGTAEIEVELIGIAAIVQRIMTASALYQRRQLSGTWGSWYQFAGTLV